MRGSCYSTQFPSFEVGSARRWKSNNCLPDLPGRTDSKVTTHLFDRRGDPSSKEGNSRLSLPWLLLGLLLCILVANGQDSRSNAYDVRAFGAKGDGTTLDTAAINRAIDAAAAAGGGTVRFPAGSYLSFSIHLKSNITLYLDQGSAIVAADPMTDHGTYDAAEPNQWDQYQDFGHSHFHNSLIWGEGLANVSIVGPGMIWGKGLVRVNAPPEGAGNKSISLKLSRNVLIREI